MVVAKRLPKIWKIGGKEVEEASMIVAVLSKP